jgi:hypothetical protein
MPGDFVGNRVYGTAKASNIDNDSSVEGDTLAQALENSLSAINGAIAAANTVSQIEPDVQQLQTDVTALQSGKANTSHNHVIADVTNLQTSLNTLQSSKQDTLDLVTQEDAEAGAGTTIKGWSEERVAQAIAAQASGGVVVQQQVFTSSGTWTKPTNLLFATVEVQGGGGGSPSGSGNYIGGGGAGGGYGRKIFAEADLAATEAVTVGAAAAGGSTNANGATGGTSSFGAHISATGGQGGYRTSATEAAGGVASFTGVGVSIPGGRGGRAMYETTAQQGGNAGGDSYFGKGAPMPIRVSAGSIGNGYGSGSSGPNYAGSGVRVTPNLAGTPGIVIVTEYLSA